MAREKKNWMRDAVKPSRKGVFKAKAEKAGKSTKEYAEEKKNAPGKLGKEARLALTFDKMRPQLATSGISEFNPGIDDVVTEAFQRCGKLASEISATEFNSAIFSLNMALVEFCNNQLNLWEVESGFLPLTAYQAVYSLPTGTVDLLEVTLRTSTRLLSGTPAASSGIAAYAFDGDPSTSCVQSAPNGNISYDWGAGVQNSVDMVGITSNVAATYTLVFEGSNDNVNWDARLTLAATDYAAAETKYYAIPAAIAYRYYRVRETGGATLDIVEVYFNQQVTDYLLSRLSRSEYISFPQKNIPGRPSAFYVNRIASPTVTFWQAPLPQYTMIYYTRITQPQTVGNGRETLPVPYRFIEALIAALAYRLAMKYAPEKFDVLKRLYDESFLMAIKEDRERVDFRITPNLTGY